jgi:hypothetical protein
VSLQEILAGYKRTSIYDRSKRRFNLNERSRDLTVSVQTFRFTAWFNTRNQRSLYSLYEPNTIDEAALDTTRRSSIYKRACITDQITSLANDFGKYDFFNSGYF